MPKDHLSEFARALGSSKGLDPIPPDQYLSFLSPDDPPFLQVHGWVLSKTIRLGHRSPFCVDANGRALTVRDIAKERGWHLSNAHKYVRQAESRGVVQVRDGKIYLCGEVQDASEPAERPEPEPEDKHMDRHGLTEKQFAAFRGLAKSRQREFLAAISEAKSYAKRLQSEAIAAAREESEDLENRIFESFEIPSSRIAKRRERETVTMPDSLRHFVQSGDPDFVQSPDRLCTKLDSGSVSLLSFRGITEEECGGGDFQRTSENAKSPMPTLSLTLAAMQKRFTTSTLEFACMVFSASVTAVQSITPRRIEVSDETVANAVVACNRETPNQKSVSLYLQKVPAILQTWAQTGIPGGRDLRPSEAETEHAAKIEHLKRVPADCQDCHGTGKVAGELCWCPAADAGWEEHNKRAKELQRIGAQSEGSRDATQRIAR